MLQHISDRTLHKRLPDSGVDDEISHLVRVINELLARLDGAFDTQRRFTADASHEICTPLTVLKGNTQVALMARRTPEEYMETLKSNLEEIERLTRLATDLLTLARFDAGEQCSSKESLTLNDLVENVCARLRPAAAESGVRLACRPLEPIVVNGEPNALQQIVLNLVTNAIRYTPGGGGVAVTVGRSPDGMAFVEVADGGKRDRSYWMLAGRWGRVLTPRLGTGPLRGTLEYGVEAIPALVMRQSNTVYAAGFTPVQFRYDFTASRRLMPYFEIGSGLLISTFQIPEESSRLNFGSHGGFGVHLISADGRSIALGARYVHISNAGIGNTNPGINTVYFYTGHSWWTQSRRSGWPVGGVR